MGVTWIEASAGTGKTYTLVQTVVDQVRRGLTVDRILLVTFTEKATAELKTRIRKGLRDAWKQTQDPVLSQALEDLASLSITTIHGFCRALLTQFPLESGVSFEPEMVDQGRQWRRLLREQIRPQLKTLDGALLGWAGLEDEEELLGMALQALNRNLFALPLAHPDPADQAAFARLRTDLEAHRGPLWEAVDQLADLTLSEDSRAAFGADTVDSLLHGRNHQGPYEAARQLAAARTWRDLVPLWKRGAKDGEKAKKKEAFDLLQTWDEDGSMWKKAATPPFDGPLEAVRSAVLAFTAAVEALESAFPAGTSLPALAAGCARHQVLSQLCVPVLAASSDRELTFFDLVDRVHRLVMAHPDSGLAAGASARWKAVLIDEFQDTDRQQWEIFSTLFGGPAHELTLVGDPKQSIYRFRGADLEVYRRVRDEVMAAGARRLVLEENFRSTADQIEAVNRLFAGADWEHSDDFSPSRKGNKPIANLVRTGPEGPAVLPPFAAFLETDEATWHRHLTATVLALLDGRHALEVDGSSEALQPGDFLILVRKKREAKTLYRLLTSKGIPATVGGSGGLLATREAQEILLFLKALEAPRSLSAARALSWTRFFAGAPVELLAPALEAAQPDRDRGAFLRAFRRVAAALEPGVADGGGMEALLGQTGGARLVTNAEHILELVQERYHRGDVAPGRAALALETWIQSRLQEDEVDLRRETEARTLRLMTVHAAKGLEAPVVLHGFPSEGKVDRSPWIVFAGGVDFLDTAEARGAEDRQARAEDLRLKYVAQTRARSYQVFLDPTIHGARPVPTYTSVEWKVLVPWSAPGPQAGTLPVLSPPLPGLEARHPWVESHSGLWRRATAAETAERTVWDRPVVRRDDEAAPGAPESLAEALPAGPAFGDLVHDILEEADWRGWAPEAPEPLRKGVRAVVEAHAQRNRSLFHGKDLSRPLNSWLGRVLGQPLALGPGTRPLILTDLSPNDTRRELEFHLPLAGVTAGTFSWGGRSFTVHPGYLTGRIDLLFRWENRLYLADWKTNRLAPGQDPAEVMAEAGYDLQAQWYWEALTRLARLQREPLEPGGVVYVFLRGAGDQARGVFLDPQSLNSVTTLHPFLKEPAHG